MPATQKGAIMSRRYASIIVIIVMMVFVMFFWLVFLMFLMLLGFGTMMVMASVGEVIFMFDTPVAVDCAA